MIMEKKQRLKTVKKKKRLRRHANYIQCGILNGILGQKMDINRKTDEYYLGLGSSNVLTLVSF